MWSNPSENHLRGLWLARELPFPPNTGNKIYAANLAKALAEAGVDLTLAGFSPAGDPPVPRDWPIKSDIVPGRPRSQLRSLVSAMPLVAAGHATAAYRRSYHGIARDDWDFVVFDHYGLGWALPLFAAKREGGRSPVLAHIAHDHETSVLESLYRNFKGSFITRTFLWQNYLKTKSLERKIAPRVDLVTAITEEDAETFTRDVPGVRTVVLTPGYSGAVSSVERSRPTHRDE